MEGLFKFSHKQSSCSLQPYSDSNSLSGLATLSHLTKTSKHSDTVWDTNAVEASSNVHSRASSVWTAPSPSQAFVSSPPRLPIGPKTSNALNHPSTSFSPATHHRSDDSTYYTALWGSPVSPDLLPGKLHRQRKYSIVTADGSPSRRVHSDTIIDLTSPAGRRAGSAGGRESRLESFELRRKSALGVASPLGQKHSRHNFTQDWVRTERADSHIIQRASWWSGESDNSDEHSPTLSQIKALSCSGGTWFQLDTESPQPRNLCIVQGMQTKENESDEGGTRPQNNHTRSRTQVQQSHSSTMSQDLMELLESSPTGEMSASLSVSTPIGQQQIQDASADSKVQIADKPLPPPPPPFDRTLSELPVLNNVVSPEELPTHLIRPSVSTQVSFQRPRKRFAWRGKACIIALPLGAKYLDQDNQNDFLKPQDVDDRLEMWKTQGYNVKGFTLSSTLENLVTLSSEGQSRTVYPDPEDAQKERLDGNFPVNIPDRREWELYVNSLKEDKLRALGVSFGEEDRVIKESPALSHMSRHASSQSSAMPISPPLAASSTTSSHTLQHLNTFPIPFSGHAKSGLHAPIAYNGPQPQAEAGLSHLSRYSIAVPNLENGLPSPYQFPQAQSPLLGSWSPQQYYKSHPGSRVTSPTAHGHLQSFGNTLSPLVLSVSDQSNKVFNQAPTDLLPQMRQQQAQIQAQLLDQQHQQHQLLLHPRLLQMSTNARNQKQAMQISDYNIQPEIITPIPRGHRQNLSETLQKEVDEAESQLEKSEVRRKGESQEDAEDNDEEKSSHVGELPVLANILQSVDKEPNFDGSDLETNPSLSGTPKTDGIKPEDSHRSHASKPSLSKLNVNAPEFVYEPKKPFAPEVFAFLGNQPNIQHLACTASLQSTSNSADDTSKGSINNGLNVAAPSFTPAEPPKPLAPSRVFSFSSNCPTFEPNAPSFQPTATDTATTDTATEKEGSGPEKIFGDIKFSEIIKPTKKSKAIPIIRPKKSKDNIEPDADGQEDESGRITQADGRQKRLRRNDVDSDEAPVFSCPEFAIPPRIGEVIHPDGPLQLRTGISEDKRVLENAANSLNKIINDLPGSEASSLMGGQEAVSADGKPWEPFTFVDARDAAIFNAARPALPSPEQDDSEHAGLVTEVKKTHVRANSENASSSSSVSPDIQLPSIISVIRNVEQDSLPAATAIPEYQKSISASEVTSGGIANDLQSPAGKKNSGSSRSEAHSSTSNEYQSVGMKRLDSEPQHSETNLNREAVSFGVDAVADVTHLEHQSYNDIDAVMKHLSNDHFELGVVRNVGPWRHRSPIRTPMVMADSRGFPVTNQLLPGPPVRSGALSPSPNRLNQPFQYLPQSDSESVATADVEMVACNARFSPSYRPSKVPVDSDNPIHRLNSPGNLPVSDWDDVMSSTDEAKFHLRTGFFDVRINDLVGGIVQQRISPLEKTLARIQESLVELTSMPAGRRHLRVTSGDMEHSDADDDDSEASQSRVKSPVRDRKYDKLKASITEISAATQNFALVSEVSKIMEAVQDLKNTIERPSQPSGDIKTAVEDAVARQLRGRSKPITSSHESATVEKNQLQIAGLESMLKIAEGRADDELKARRATEDALADSQRLLRMAMQEAAEQRESAEETERSLAAFHDERQQVLRRNAMLEGAQESLQKTASDLTEKNVALEGTLEEYRLSSSQWREEVEEAKIENKDLRRTISALTIEIEESIRGRQSLRIKFDRLQDNMTQASRDIARDQSLWRSREEEHKSTLELLDTKLNAESSTRERLEHEIVKFVEQEKATSDLRHAFERSQRENARLEDMIAELRAESHEHQKSATRLDCLLQDARESANLEMDRTRTALEADIEIANIHVNTTRLDLEGINKRLQSQLEDATTDAASTKARYESMLEEASDSRNAALREAAEAREAALQEHYRFHERTLDESKAQHAREMKNALEENERSKVRFGDRLALADDKVLHLEDKVRHLEEKLDIAKTAAQQLVIQSKKAGSSPSPSRASILLARGSELPEKISPQALRESIMVLQEQLQEREGRIEQLELEQSKIDKDAPAKLKDQEIEITWLRELLSVRVDELEDIITTVSQPSYDRDAVKDAAIRLKANLQMEQQEKERALTEGQTFPSLTSISTLTSSPRALPLAAAAAWGNWRRVRDTSFGSLSGIASGSPGQTPSRSSPSAQGFLSGLLTPPSTNIRQTPQTDQSARTLRPTASSSKQPADPYRTPRQSLSLRDENRPLAPVGRPETPPLMRKASYDGDAESMGFGEDEHNAAYIAAGNAARDEPFGLNVPAFSRQT